MMRSLNPYLTFNGNCEQAFVYYRSVFGGEFTLVQKFKDMPVQAGLPPIDAAAAERIMHIALPIGAGSVLMGSDTLPGQPEPPSGSAVALSFVPASEEEARRVFADLAEGGHISMPLEKAFWGALFGMVIDRFGMCWMINYQDAAAGVDH